MSITSFQENSPSWQIELVKQRLQEWWELKISQLELNSPELSFLDSPLIRLLIKTLLWSLIAIILVWLVWQTWLLFRPLLKNWSRQRQKFTRSQVWENPQKSQLSPQDWLTQAQDYYQQQNYRQGIFCLYQGILQYLSDRHKETHSLMENKFVSDLSQIATVSSLTDGEYLTIIQQSNFRHFPSYKLLFLTHEKLCFSSFLASASLFDQCHQAYILITNK